jgi:hypothetical protein
MSTDLFEGLNGHDVIGGRQNRRESIIVTRPSHFRGLRWLRRGQRDGKPGAGMIAVATGLLFLLGAGLLAVSLAAQYSYLYRQRHQSATSLVEALALDVGMLIFSLLALGLARSGKPAKVERILIMVCAAGSAGMNFAAANDASPRSILAYTMPPVFLAIVADRVISVVRRHFLGDQDAHSAWSAASRVVLYGLRLAVAAPSTMKGARRVLLNATPLPELVASKRVECPSCHQLVMLDAADRIAAHSGVTGVYCCGWPQDWQPREQPETAGKPIRATATVIRNPRAGTKAAELLKLVIDRHGPLEALPLGECSKIATELAGEVDIHPASARAVLLKRTRAAQNGHSDTEASA